MKVLFIIPGSGDSFYCGNCFRDNLYVSALRKAGHEIVIMPLYLPLRQPSFRADTPLYFPATTYYVAQKFFRDKKMPHWLQHLTGSDAMLKLASSLSGTTSPEGMEEMTISMITGEGPVFAEYVTPMVDRIKNIEKPDIIHLSSTLLLGIAKELRSQLEIPIVCSVQDEEIWIDNLNDKYASAAWQGITDNIRHIDHFVTTSEFYRNVIGKRIPQISPVTVVYPGVDRDKYASEKYPDTPVIGFFYRMNQKNGLDILAEAFILLKKRNSIPGLKLSIGGGFTREDKKFLKQVRKKLSPYNKDVMISQNYSLEDHKDFYRTLSVVSVPIRFEEAVGLYLCEAFAAGRPAVKPATGSFPEIVGNAGLLYQPNDSHSLADALEKLLTNKELYDRSVAETHHLSSSRYNGQAAANMLVTLYNNLK